MLSLGLVAVGQPKGWGPFPWAASSPRAGGDGGAVDSGCPRSPGCGFRVSQISRTPRYPPWELGGGPRPGDPPQAANSPRVGDG